MKHKTYRGPRVIKHIVKGYADTSAGQIHYRHLPGPPDAVPLLFFHRVPATSLSFVPMMNAMAGERPLYAFDMPGFGASFDPAFLHATMTTYAEWMLEAVHALGIARAHVFGHHTGMHLAAEMAVIEPAMIITLVLNGIACLTPEERAVQAAHLDTAVEMDANGKYLMDTFWRIKGLCPTGDLALVHEETISALRAFYTRPRTLSVVWTQDFPGVIKKVRCPVLATTAADDVWRSQFERVFSDCPDAERKVLGPASFYTPEIDTAAAVNAIREFISRHQHI